METVNDIEVNLSEYFSQEQLNKMGAYERKRYSNLLKNYSAMAQMGLSAKLPDFAISKKKLIPKHGKKESGLSSEQIKQPLERRKESKPVRRSSTRDKKVVQRYQPPAKSLKIEMNSVIEAEMVVDCPELGSDGSCYSEDFVWSTDSEDSFEFSTTKKKGKVTSKSCQIKSNTKVCLRKEKILPKRKCATMHSYTEEEVDDDAYIYCEDCQLEYPDDCYLHPLEIVKDTQIPVGEQERAKKTLPQGLSISKSKIKGAGLGVWTDVKVNKFTRFGPYEGVSKPCKDLKTDGVSGYGWLVTSCKMESFYIDGEDVVRSNWMRYVNCARNKWEQNLEAFQYKGKIYYKTLVDIKIGNELLVWYGDDYAADLGIKKEEHHVPELEKKFNPPENSDGYKCEICGAKFVNSSSFTRHRVWHTSQSAHISAQEEKKETRKFHDCLYCGKVCATANSLLLHLRTHTGEKPYKCTQCEARFTRSDHLTTHMRTHTGERPYKCTQCEARFTQSSDLTKHMRTHTGEKPYKCTECEARFTICQNLTRHMRTHTGEKPYKCTECEARFTLSQNLTNHMRIHTGERPYKCTQCEARFTRSSTLTKHMKSHRGEKTDRHSLCETISNLSVQNKKHDTTPSVIDIPVHSCANFPNEV